ncbi:MAG: hypothetical protein MZU95_01655 [Desulfomicrobium escambiense]|nr:hypothetical protein [Desulfomicrobium escambiense]
MFAAPRPRRRRWNIASSRSRELEDLFDQRLRSPGRGDEDRRRRPRMAMDQELPAPVR